MEPLAVLNGTVVHGNGLGRTVDMPTANLLPSGSQNLPEGVYASYVHIGSERYTGVTNIGRRPTVDSDDRITIETNIIGFDDDIYGKQIQLDIMYFLRPVRRMESLGMVKRQVDEDRKRAVDLLG